MGNIIQSIFVFCVGELLSIFLASIVKDETKKFWIILTGTILFGSRVFASNVKDETKRFWIRFTGIILSAGIFIFGFQESLLPMPIGTSTAFIVTVATSIPTPTMRPILEPTDIKDVPMILVTGGEFTMGSDNGESNEKPVHTVYLDTFWIDLTEVTNKQYQACVEASVCEPPSSISSDTHPYYYGNPEFDDYPVIYVTWDQANKYCEAWAGGDLPSEAQWEKAASWNDIAQEKYIYSWGSDFDGSLVNFCDVNCAVDWADKNSNDGYADTAPVGNYSNGFNSYGIYDMAGNVWEWVNDRYSASYYQSSPSSNPLGPASGNSRVLRGGSWHSFDYRVRSTYRYGYISSYVQYDLGFRCARGTSP